MQSSRSGSSGCRSNGSQNGSCRPSQSAPRHRQRGGGGSQRQNNSSTSAAGQSDGSWRHERHDGIHSSNSDRHPGGTSQHALEQQWSLAGGAWGSWNTPQHFPHPPHNFVYSGGDFRVYSPMMPIQTVAPYGDYVYSSGHASNHPTQMSFYPPPTYVEYTVSSPMRAHMSNNGVGAHSSGRGGQSYLLTEVGSGYGITTDVGCDDNNSNSPSPSQVSPAGSTESTEEVINVKRGSNNNNRGTHVNPSVIEYQSSDDDEDDDSENGSHYQSIISATFEKYESESTTEDAGRISKLLLEVCQSGAVSCLICISSVKRTQPVWSCERCSCMYHLQCIQKWARDSIEQTKMRLEAHGDTSRHDMHSTNLTWDCPKCRYEYSVDSIPEYYFCFCGKTCDPEFDPWLVPHACGQSCDKPLISPSDHEPCGHRCTLLCHPGPCPPCPQTVQVKCQCGSSSPVPRRCSAQIWMCSNKCGKLLNCGKHYCADLCHPGDCGQCKLTAVEKCECGAKERLTLCSSVQWKCETVCGKLFDCGQHTCKATCHVSSPDGCGQCPNSGNRTCPCGSVTYSRLECTDVAATCDNECGKLLACGDHFCSERCHSGDCGSCKEPVRKQCPCTRKTRLIQCSQNFTCDLKCGNYRNCGRHQCKKKCCVGDCAPCDQVCLKNLPCANHRCQQRCHAGPCYPCQQTKVLSCPCGATSIEVPCGREKVVKRPNCQKSCMRPPSCHHPTAKPHKCHSGYCPPCDKVCEMIIDKCGHKCLAKCHSAVWTKIKPKTLLNNESVQFKQVEQPCPPCRTQVEISCFGQHETINIQCAKGKPYSCGVPCGRQLSCGNHTCERICHVVHTAPDESTAGADCDVCERGCELERPLGCNHFCCLPCHLAPCPPCNVKVSKKCLCGHLTLLIHCYVWTDANEEERQQLLNGSHPCPLQMDCGHACPLACHPPGKCLAAEECTKRATVRCGCGRIKQDILCKNVPHTPRIPCDRICEERIEKKRRQKEKRSNSPQNDSSYTEEMSNDFNQNTSSRMASLFQRQSNRNNSSQPPSAMTSSSSRNQKSTKSQQKQNQGPNNNGAASSTNDNNYNSNNRSSAQGDDNQSANQSTKGANNSRKGKGVSAGPTGQNKPVSFYKRAYFIPLLLALLAIIFALYISLSAEYVS